MADETHHLIFTDPPYDRETIPQYEDLAALGARVLIPGGSLITYVGH
jgi:16S rRNA G966 N2-methylase RsmD